MLEEEEIDASSQAPKQLCGKQPPRAPAKPRPSSPERPAAILLGSAGLGQPRQSTGRAGWPRQSQPDGAREPPLATVRA